MSRKNLFRLAILVTLIGGVGYAWWFARTHEQDALFSASGPAPPSVGQSSFYQEALDDYQSGLYAEAINGFEAHLAVHPDDTEATFLMGLCCLETGEEDRAIALMDEVRINDPGYYQDATWYMGLACLKEDQTDMARRLMEELSSGEDSFYRAKAHVILERFL
ncbi:MAG: tetratricopeptide repeat protein [Saprospiraceae bacterium]|nr:tetratricopeptide repeat protein [Saprospiraceae bacterium]